jgi:hypothetical protein
MITLDSQQSANFGDPDDNGNRSVCWLRPANVACLWHRVGNRMLLIAFTPIWLTARNLMGARRISAGRQLRQWKFS